ncbi:BrnT family toxin [bacterium]|nr:BrnT family toxin [bacterium]
MTTKPNESFETDSDKAARKKHRVSFEEAATVFADPMFITFIDEEHSVDEERYITIGLSNRGRLLIVAHTNRQDRIRVISARKATKKEERFYAEAE